MKQTQKEKRLFIYYITRDFAILAIFQYRNNSLNDSTFFRVYLVTILKAISRPTSYKLETAGPYTSRFI